MTPPLLAIALLLSGLLFAAPADALNAAVPLRELNHTVWSDRDGVPPDAGVLAQTRDGWLWIATKDGLHRFDGLRFERLPLARNQIHNLRALPNGDLLIGYYFDGVSVLHPDGTVEDLGPAQWSQIESPGSMDMDRAGVIWAVSLSGVHRYRNGRWETLMSGPEWHDERHNLVIDQYDRVWVGSGTRIFLLNRERDRFQPLPGAPIPGLLMHAPDGQLWAATYTTIRPVPMPPTGRPLPRRPDSNPAESRSHGQFDREGNLWLLKCPVGLCRIPRSAFADRQPVTIADHAQDRLDQYWQLSSLATSAVMEDREGNIWVATHGGLDRFRANKLVPVNIPSPSGVFSIASDTEGQLWAADSEHGLLWKVPADGPPALVRGRYVRVLGNDRNGALLLVGKREITRVYQGESSTIAVPTVNGKPADLTILGVLDDGKVLWLMSLQTGLMGLVDGQWKPRSAFNLPPRISSSATGDTGQLWLGHNDGTLHLYDNGRLSSVDIRAVGNESGIFPGSPMVVAGEYGIAVQRGQRFELLGPPRVEALRNVTGMITTANGDRWLNGAQGVVHIRSEDWEAALREPARPLRFDLIDALEGYPGRAANDNRLQTVIKSSDQLLWFRGTGGLVRMNLAAVQPNTVRPTVQLLRVETAAGAHPIAARLQLPPGTSNFSVQYTAPGLRKPEGMRFQYQLEGLDPDWQDAGSRRAAYYTNVGPGKYTFRVRAVNEDGVFSESTATLPIEIEPSTVQTWWFRSLCALTLAALMYALHKYRVRIATRQTTRQVHMRLQAGLAERERIARTLHDTFLQSVQALSLQINGVILGLPEDSEPRGRLKRILKSATYAIDEGRAQVQQLRRGSDPVLKLSQLGDYLMLAHPGATFELVQHGTPRELHPAVQEEIGEIGQEALRNAFQHAEATAVSVTIIYGADDVTLRVSDNGKGMDPRLRKPGRWGLLGMRERAQNLGTRLHLESAPGRGTTVQLQVPAAQAYPSPPQAAA
ncbi:sensor histidine kinase [Duganella callida]|uniref:Histidine kinase domain-containing protein n=1 Tax=Duganella callida TaxID=2561932 RepID=A0A4Y9SVE4_9BURK|nr:sensor histidine kinase [Duganella callida]TFW28716.1 hypothetical protein E4L98_05290 [Duganella callida]